MPQSPSSDPDDRTSLGIAIVGTGSIGDLTEQVIDSLPDTRVVSTVSAREFSPECLQDEAIDVVAVCSANGLHVEHAHAAVAAGKHVVIEKPLTLDVAQGRELLQAAEAAGVRIGVISQRRWEPFVRATNEAIASGVMGRPVLAECLLRWQRDAAYFEASPWRGTRDMDGGVLFNQGVHLLDLMRWLMGHVETVSAHDATLVRPIEAPDTVTATVRFASGALGTVSATVASTEPSPAQLNLYFEKGTIRLADDRLVTWDVPGVAEPSDDSAVGSGSQDPTAIGLVGHRRQWVDIISALKAGSAPGVEGRDALGTAAFVAAIHSSAERDGEPITPEVK